jgi:SpoIVB peptidase S55.
VNPENGEIYTISGGTVYECEINGIIKSERGKAGELKGTFKDKEIGVIDKNNKFGVYGYLNQDYFINNEKIEIIRAKDVKPGKVKILTTIHGNKPMNMKQK